MGGPGADELIGLGRIRDPFETPGDTPMHIDFDGVADDGRPGENDNVNPGQWLEVFLRGGHTVIGHDGVDLVTISGLEFEAGDHVDGLGGGDDIETGPAPTRSSVVSATTRSGARSATM